MRNTLKTTKYPKAKHYPVPEKPDTPNLPEVKSDINQSLQRNINGNIYQANMLWNILDAMDDIIFLVSRNGTIRYTNSAVKQLFKEDLTERLFDSISSLRAHLSFSTIKHALQSGNSVYLLPSLDISTGNTIRYVDLIAQYFSESPDDYIIILRNRDEQFTKDSSLLQKIVYTQENERNRIALNLHDSLGQKISASKFFIYTAMGNNESASRESLLLRANKILHEAVHELREICFDLMPRSLETEGIEETLKDLIATLQVDKSITFSLNIAMKGFEIEPSIELDLFRIIQELITNSIKHGDASEISVSLFATTNLIKLVYQDNGKGFKVTSQYKGHGLRNIELRVASNNGELTISSIPNKETLFTIIIPFNF